MSKDYRPLLVSVIKGPEHHVSKTLYGLGSVDRDLPSVALERRVSRLRPEPRKPPLKTVPSVLTPEQYVYRTDSSRSLHLSDPLKDSSSKVK